MRIHLLLPNTAEKQDIYISKIQLEQGETVTAYEKTRYVNQQIAGFINRIKSINFEQRSVLQRFYFYEDALKYLKHLLYWSRQWRMEKCILSIPKPSLFYQRSP